MKPDEKTIKQVLKKLRRMIDTETDPIVIAFAYENECVLRWATEDTEGWSTPDRSAVQAAESLKSNLKRTEESNA